MRRRRAGFAMALLIIVGLVLLIRAGYSANWTGFGSSVRATDPKQEFIPAKTLWNWLELFIIPIVLAAGSLWFSRTERRSEQAIAEDRMQEATLQTYLEQMSDLLVDKGLRYSVQESAARDVARAWTLTVLRRLDRERKAVLLRFLYESDLIIKDVNVFSLKGADLGDADLWSAGLMGANLSGVYLNGADLQYANLKNVDLRDADLMGANLHQAKLNGANLEDANLQYAKLTGADLKGVRLIGADLSGADLRGADLSEAITWINPSPGIKPTRLSRAEYDKLTKWRENFDPRSAGAILVEEKIPLSR